MNPILLLFCVISLSVSQGKTIICGDGPMILDLNVEMQTINCTNIVLYPSFYPKLPEGITYSSGTISGTPTEPFPMTKFLIRSPEGVVDNQGVMWLGVMGEPTKFSVNWRSQTVFAGMPVFPVFFEADVAFETYTITPSLPHGLVLDPIKGRITGTYMGDTQTVSYVVKASNRYGELSVGFDLVYQASNDNKYLSVCYLLDSAFILHPYNWYYSAPNVCTTMSSLTQYNDRESLSADQWENLPEQYENNWSAVIRGYIVLPIEGALFLNISVNSNMRMYIDDDDRVPVYETNDNSPHVHVDILPLNLTQGYHSIEIQFLSNGDPGILDIKYSYDGVQYHPFTEELLRLGGYAPAQYGYHQRDADTLLYLANQFHCSTPIYYGSMIKNAMITPPLPSGLSINNHGSICGTHNSSLLQQFSVTAYGELGVANCTVLLSIAPPLPGITTTYNIVKKSELVCVVDSFPPESLERVVVENEEKIDFPNVEQGHSWNSLPSEIFSYNYIHMIGYLHLSEVGAYSFRIMHKQGIQTSLSSLPLHLQCGNEVKINDMEVEIPAEEWHPFELEFIIHNENYHLQMFWKTPSSSSYTIVPPEAFGSSPETVFSYSSPYMYSIVGHSYQNTPILFGAKGEGSFSTASPLPEGLTMRTDGVITGTFVAPLNETSIEVTAVLGALVFKTIIRIRVEKVEPPTLLVVKDASGAVISGITSEPYHDIGVYTIHVDHTPCFYTITPSLPAALKLEGNTISGFLNTVSFTSYIITAKNSAGSTSNAITIHGVACKYGHYIYTTLDTLFTGSVTIYKNTTVVYEARNIQPGEYTSVACLPPDVYTYRFVCNGEYIMCHIRVKRDDETLFFKADVTDEEEFTSELYLASPPPPEFTLLSPSAVIVHTGDEISFSFQVKGIYAPLKYTPFLPESLHFNEDMMVIKGIIDSPQVIEMTITCYNDGGSVEIPLFIQVSKCKNPSSVFLSFVRNAISDYEAMEMYNSKGAMVYNSSYFFHYATQYACLTYNDEYLILLKGKPWKLLSDLQIYDGEMHLLGSFMKESRQAEERFVFHPYPLLLWGQEGSVYYEAASPSKAWKTEKMNDNKWKSLVLSYWQKDWSETPTVYVQKVITIHKVFALSMLTIDMELMDGIILYWNGIEIARQNMEDGEVKHDTLAIAGFPTLTAATIMVPSTLQKKGDNILAAEIHRWNGTQRIAFDWMVRVIGGNLIPLSINGIASGSDHVIVENHEASKAFDQDMESYWMDEMHPVFLQYDFRGYSQYAANYMIIRATRDDIDRNPSTFSVYGHSQRGKYLKILDYHDYRLVDQFYQTVLLPLSQSSNYRGYQMMIHDPMDHGNATMVNEVSFVYRPSLTCSWSWFWPSTALGKDAHRGCDWGQLGQKRRFCGHVGDSVEWEAVDSSECLPKRGKNESYIDMRMSIHNFTLNQFFYFTSTFESIFRKNLVVKNLPVLFSMLREIGTNDNHIVSVYTRVTAPVPAGDWVLQSMQAIEKNINTILYEAAPSYFPKDVTIGIDEHSVIYKPFNPTPMILTLLVLSILLVSILVYIWLKRKKHRSIVKEAAISSKESELIHLLENQSV